MITGYTRPLYLLPFDHRASYISGLFGWKEPLNVEQMVIVAHSKHVIYEGFQRAIADHVPKDRVGILVDEEFGSAILRDAASKGYITVVSVEKSGQEEFEFAYGEDFAQHIEDDNHKNDEAAQTQDHCQQRQPSRQPLLFKPAQHRAKEDGKGRSKENGSQNVT
jgi:hypothetical protein